MGCSDGTLNIQLCALQERVRFSNCGGGSNMQRWQNELAIGHIHTDPSMRHSSAGSQDCFEASRLNFSLQIPGISTKVRIRPDSVWPGWYDAYRCAFRLTGCH